MFACLGRKIFMFFTPKVNDMYIVKFGGIKSVIVRHTVGRIGLLLRYYSIFRVLVPTSTGTAKNGFVFSVD